LKKKANEDALAVQIISIKTGGVVYTLCGIINLSVNKNIFMESNTLFLIKKLYKPSTIFNPALLS